MKNYFPKPQPLAFLLLLFVVSLQSCLKDDCEETRLFVQIDPVYMAEDQIRIEPAFESPRTLENSGKIYLYDNYLMIGEQKQGIHIFDNSDPTAPTNLGFIKIPGNVDIAIKDDILYADNYMDILTIDISDITDPILTCRDLNVFSQFWFDENRGAWLVDWRATDRQMEIECTDPNFGNGFFNRGGDIFANVDVAFEAADGGGNDTGGNTGTGGSLARFTIAKNHLYAIDQWQLHTFDLENAQKPERLETLHVGWGIETNFTYGDNLFLGANDGLYIYSISNPGEPRFLSNFTHARACDPVYVQGDIAYVTLRNGTRCQSFTNQLDVLDVSDLTNPKLIVTHEMDNPHGLSVRNDHLFICEGIKGIKSFDKSNLDDIPSNMLDQKEDIYAVDVISVSDDHIIVIGPDGLFQYSVAEDGDMNLISDIQTSK